MEELYRQRWTWDTTAWATHCVDCFLTGCPHRVYVRDGMVVREEQSGTFEVVEEGVPDYNPMGCQKGAAWSQQLYAPDRLLYPMRRAGERGGGRWERISWDEACTTIADAMLDAIQQGGPKTIVHEGSPENAAITPTLRFLNCIGGHVLDTNASISDFSVGLHETFGKMWPASSTDDWFLADLILIWHMNPAYTRIPSYHFVLEARYRGAEVVSISPDLNASHMHADYHVPMPPGDDAAFGLAMVQVILAEELADYAFVCEQTDLPLLVRTDTLRYLRQTDVEGPGPDAREDQLYYWDPAGGLAAADLRDLTLNGREPALEGSYRVTLYDGTDVEVEPVFSILKRKLDAEYTPEMQQVITGVHPEVVRTLARKAASKRTKILLGWNSCKYYHGDLMERAMCLLLAVTGNWGKRGAGIDSWAGIGSAALEAKQGSGPEATEQALRTFEEAIASVQRNDPTLTEEMALRELVSMVVGGGGMSPPAFWWYRHTGHAQRWSTKEWGDLSLPRTFDQYVEEAIDRGWWQGLTGPAEDETPRVLFECAGNMLRRTRGGQTLLLETLWPKLDLVVSIDYRMSFTALFADIVLPAAQHYETMRLAPTTPMLLHLVLSDRAADPPGEAKADRDIFRLILEKLAERAGARGIDEYRDRRGASYRPADMPERYGFGGSRTDEERRIDEDVRDRVYAGFLPEGTTLKTLRERGHVRLAGWGMGSLPWSLAQASPFPSRETHSPFRDHVESKVPYPTYSRRAQFYIDHPWFLEAGEELPVHKPNPRSGGDYPLRMTSGHNRWSIHAMNTTNGVLLQTHRGEPHVVVSIEDARARGVTDGDLIRISNDIASFTARAKISASARPGQIISYNGWEPFQYRDWKGANEIEAGMVKSLAFAGGYGHLRYLPLEWQPQAVDRATPCDFGKA